MKRLSVCVFCVLIVVWGPMTEKSALGIPVFDSANLAQAVKDHAQRLVEIGQRATQLANEAQILEYWFFQSLQLGEIPYVPEQFEFLEELREILTQFDALKDQYQALSYALENVGDEFELTFPGWRPTSSLTAVESLELDTEAGLYSFDGPLELEQYRESRVHQSVAQALKSMARHQGSILNSQLHLEELKGFAQESLGAQQTRELQTSFAALSTEQLVALRETQQKLALAAQLTLVRDVDGEMRHLANQEAASRALEEAVIEEFGASFPEHTGAGGRHPYPSWVVR